MAASHPVQGYGSRIEKAAHQMRGRGYSYRRISRELHVRYDLVTSWLSGSVTGPSAVTPDRRIEPSFAAARPLPMVSNAPLPSAAIEPAKTVEASEQAVRIASLEQRIKDLLASLMQLSLESREREARLYQVADNDRDAARAREQRYFDEMQQLRSTVKGLEQRLGYVSPPEVEIERPRRFFWQRGRSE